MNTTDLKLWGGAVGVVGLCLIALTFEYPPMVSQQIGYRGTGMEQISQPEKIAAVAAANVVPVAIDPVEPSGTLAKDVYQNVQVLGDVDSDQFNRLMAAITEWVAPEQGCTYCHAEGEELSSDSLYTKVVARRMLQMNLAINSNWKDHVAGTGVTCYTCHRGQPVPANVWFNDPGPRTPANAGNKAGQNMPAAVAGLSSLPFDPLTPFLEKDNQIRVIGSTALPTGNRSSIKQAEWTYSLMFHMSESLGVNCTYCHNTRSFAEWGQSAPQRATAWYGIRMARDINDQYLNSLAGVFPANRLGPHGDVPKANCATCHQGANKPLLGVSMLPDYPELAGPATQ